MMKSRKEAKEAGEIYYITGKPCPKGHVTKRRVNGGCYECGLQHNRSNYDPKKNLARNQTWYSKNREISIQRARKNSVARRYGLTIEAYEARISQGFCDICGTTEPGGSKNKFHMDHNHTTGEVRGILCSSCNLGLGKFKDDPNLLSRAEAYLRGRTIP